MLVRAALVILLLNLLSRLLGFVRDAVITWRFGAGGMTDAYLVAYTIPYALEAVLGMSLVTVIVPTLTRYLVQGEMAEGRRVASAVVSGAALLLAGLTALGLVLAPALVQVLAPGFGPEEAALAVRLTRIMFPSIIFMGLGLMLSGILNTHKRFALPALAPALVNLVIILAVVLLGGRYGVEGLAVGTLAGFFCFWLVQLPGMGRISLRPGWGWDFRHPQVRQVIRAIIPVTFATGVNQVNLAANRFFASGLAAGSITALDLANRVMNLPLGVFAAAVATAVFPALAEKAARDDGPGLAREFTAALRLVSLTMLPCTVGLAVLREPVVRLLFERGAFQEKATAMTAGALLYFSLGLLFLGGIYLLTRAYYSLGDLKTPARVGLAAVAANVVFSLLLLPLLGHRGLALANTLAAVVNAGLLYYLLGKRIPLKEQGGLGEALAKMAAAALLMGLAVAWGRSWLCSLAGSPSFVTELLLLLLLVAWGAAVYGVLVCLLGLEEGKKLLSLVKRSGAR
ncbi:MAG TPA: murein biosynthesis integral membrane protein MurJ [Clostridia bacterium]|nr:murein biosynthesis integral membrane protein MurJ [Clostridia bacterium]